MGHRLRPAARRLRAALPGRFGDRRAGRIGGGTQHASLRGALTRAAVGGTLFGLSILLGYALNGSEGAEVDVPEPAILLLAFTLIPAFPLHWLGWRLARGRR